MNFARFARFLRETSGAITVDWVVLTAAVTGLGFVAAMSVGGAATSAAGGVAGNVGSSVAAAEANNEDKASASDDEPTSSDDGSTTSSSSEEPPQETTPFSGKSARDYVDYGQSKAPGNNGAVYYWAQQAASADAPDGYNFTDPIYDQSSGNVVYTSNDGSKYSVGGKVYSKEAYTGTTSYYGA